jgi:hypothetical protein
MIQRSRSASVPAVRRWKRRLPVCGRRAPGIALAMALFTAHPPAGVFCCAACSSPAGGGDSNPGAGQRKRRQRNPDCPRGRILPDFYGGGAPSAVGRPFGARGGHAGLAQWVRRLSTRGGQQRHGAFHHFPRVRSRKRGTTRMFCSPSRRERRCRPARHKLCPRIMWIRENQPEAQKRSFPSRSPLHTGRR